MKSSKSQIHAKLHRIPQVDFERTGRLTAFSGLVVFMQLFRVVELKRRLRGCFAHVNSQQIFGGPAIMLLLVVHLVLGFRRLRDVEIYKDDPLVLRLLGLRSIPNVSTISRTLAGLDLKSVEALRHENRDLVVSRLMDERLPRLTLDFDGSVQSTKRHAEGTAVGFNKQKKGARSNYPLFCTVAQTSQFLDHHHRSGNVHDSNGAADFMKECIRFVGVWCPWAELETRLDSAFFSDAIINDLQQLGVEFSCSVPFERFVELKSFVETQRRWKPVDEEWSYFEKTWKPKSWEDPYRFIFVRRRQPVQRKQPLQLDLFEPRDFEYSYKVIITNKMGDAGDVLYFHNGRGSQEKVFGEAKQHAALGIIPTRCDVGNRAFTVAAALAHNLGRELQMRTRPLELLTTPKRAPHWAFQTLGRIRDRIIRRPGRLVAPQGRLTLRMSAGDDEQAVRGYLDGLAKKAA